MLSQRPHENLDGERPRTVASDYACLPEGVVLICFASLVEVEAFRMMGDKTSMNVTGKLISATATHGGHASSLAEVQ